ncbi:hypothetical protein FEM03_00555 [Phragmitibacter flavus]|uniref:Pyrrolo-quinoline quinone repeat domain-containing protein n=1 Tax=Phragmitibacter flavus TaxID=2576071 RepID=A0A5R8KK34_9BACT|nr:PQQ-binding-like beta-propeller repeat protein [Phragmitibacter flavus]TLD72601.1 hypothetical protein FEM03_00555 [Phragmitibacter flavus]
MNPGTTSMTKPHGLHRGLMIGFIIALAFLLCLLASAPAQKSESISAVSAQEVEVKAVDWPHFQGPARNNTTTESGWTKDWPADGPPTLWKANVGRGLASFAVVGNRIYTAGNDGADKDVVVCLDLDSGKELWRFEYACVTATHPMPIVPYGPGATPTVVDGRVFTLSREGHLHALDAGTGKLIWKKHLVEDFKGKRPVYGYAGSVLAEGGHLFVDNGGDTQSTLCLEQKSGEIIWAKGKGEAGYATPGFASFGSSTRTLVLFKGEALTLLDPSNGNLLAEYAATTRDFSNCATPYVNGNRVFISHTGSQGSSVFNYADGKLKSAWNDRDLGLLFNSGVPWEGNLIAFNDQKRGAKDFRCIDLTTGGSLWVNSDIDKGTAILSDGHLLILTNTGELVLAKPGREALEIVSRVQVLAGKGYVLPVLSNGRILCKNNAGDVVCLDVRAK